MKSNRRAIPRNALISVMDSLLGSVKRPKAQNVKTDSGQKHRNGETIVNITVYLWV